MIAENFFLGLLIISAIILIASLIYKWRVEHKA